MIQEDDTYVIQGPPPLEMLPNITLGKLAYDRLSANIDRSEALVHAVTKESVSYEELLNKTCLLAQSLKISGYGKNTITAICSENNIQFFIPVMSCFYVGAIIAPISHFYTEEEAMHTLNISKPKVVFCSKAHSRKYVVLKNTKLTYIERIIIIDSADEIRGAKSLDSFIKQSLKGNLRLDRFVLEEFDPTKQGACIMSSSGTTGLPKGVMQTHTNIVTRIMHSQDPRYSRKRESFLGFLPFFHAFGFITNLESLMLGQKVVVMSKFEENIFLKTIQDYKIPMLFVPPPIVLLLAKSPLVAKYDLSCVQEVASGAAPLSEDIEELVKKRLNIPLIRQAYGLTEATFCITTVGANETRRGSSGQVISYMSCKVRCPKNGRSLGPGATGEICVKGPMVALGYYGNVEATRNAFTSDGWLLTGDLGYYDSEGYFYIVDRLKELIKYKGYQVAPSELEAVLLTNPKIQDAGVVGLPDEEAGELPLAFVVKQSNSTLTEKEVVDFVKEKLSPQKRLRGGVIFVPAIPKSPSGKILRRELRIMLKSCESKL